MSTNSQQTTLDVQSDTRVSGPIEITLTDEELNEVKEIARARNQSYQAGKTADTNYADSDGQSVHEQGIKAELALARCYETAEVDRSVSATGDDGVDAQLEIDGELVDVDVKSTAYRPPWLMVKRGFSHEEADAFVVAVVDGATVEFHGFAWADDLLVEDNLEVSPAPGQTHQNYTMKGGYESMPIPDSERADFSR